MHCALTDVLNELLIHSTILQHEIASPTLGINLRVLRPIERSALLDLQQSYSLSAVIGL